MENNYWDLRYQKNETGWDLGDVAPAFYHFFEKIKDKQISILIPGCGNAYEAALLIQLGFEKITLVDISPLLVSNLKKKFHSSQNQGLQIICDDFFNHQGQYDLIIEQTFFCALNPALRQKYVTKMKSLLKKDGRLVGLLFNREFPNNPPYGGSEAEYRKLFSHEFEIIHLAQTDHSATPRKGSELWMEMVVK